MQAVAVVNRLKEILPSFTDDFSDVISLTSLTRVDTTITAISPVAHNLTNGDYITIRGAKEPITLISLNRSSNIVTVISSTDHKLSDPSLYGNRNLPIYVEISGADAGYNGSWELLSVPDDTTFTFKIIGTPATPSTAAGYLLLEDQDGYNGYKQVTAIDATTFTYPTTNTNLKTPAQGVLELSNGTRIDYSATASRVLDFYSANSANVLKTWAFVVAGGETTYRNDTVGSDVSSAQIKGQDFYYQDQQDFSIYIVIPSKGSVLGGTESDLARTYKNYLLKSIANYIFSSDLTEVSYQPCTYVDNEPDDYVKAYYVHRFDFSIMGFIQAEDTAEFSNGVPLQLINGSITDTTMTYTPRMR